MEYMFTLKSIVACVTQPRQVLTLPSAVLLFGVGRVWPGGLTIMKTREASILSKSDNPWLFIYSPQIRPLILKNNTLLCFQRCIVMRLFYFSYKQVKHDFSLLRAYAIICGRFNITVNWDYLHAQNQGKLVSVCLHRFSSIFESTLPQNALRRDCNGKCIEIIEGHYLEVVVLLYNNTC